MKRTIALSAVCVLCVALSGCSGVQREQLPHGLPASVGVIAGDVSNAVTKDADHWSFAVTVDDSSQQDSAREKLRSEGFDVTGEYNTGEVRTCSLEKDELQVSLLMTDIANKPAVVYNVARVQKK